MDRSGTFPVLAIACALAVVLGAGAFAPLLLHPAWIQDDWLVVAGNRVAERASPGEILTSPYWAGTGGIPELERSLYRPATIGSFALERAGRPPSPRRSRLVNLVIHLCVSVLVGLVGRRLGLSDLAAGAAALLFAVHPVHAEALGMAVGRAELLAAFFTLAALDRWGRPLAAASLALLALLSKETAIAAPVLLLAYDRLVHRTVRWRTYVPLAAAAGLWIALRALALGTPFAVQQVMAIDNPLAPMGFLERLPYVGLLLLLALKLCVLPAGLAADWSGTTLVGAAVPGRLRGRPAAFAALLFLLPWLVTSNLLVPVGAIFAERFLYLPSAGIVLLGALLLDRLPARALVPVVAVLALAGTVATHRRAQDFRDDAALFSAAMAVHPEAPRAPAILAHARAKEGRTDEAIALYARALELWPDAPAVRFERGVLHAQEDAYGPAEEDFRAVLASTPRFAPARFNLGLVLARTGRPAQAAQEFREALQADPGHEGARRSLAALEGGRVP